MVGGGIDGVDTDDVGSQLGQQRHISSTAGFVGEGVLNGVCGGCLLLVCDALDEEFGSVRLVEEVRSLEEVSMTFLPRSKECATLITMGSTSAATPEMKRAAPASAVAAADAMLKDFIVTLEYVERGR